uniref:t-SNARE coiled-coil homology domain-containing protein n=1 Tax=Rhabditophanes sp. KR3021 TaxID=114890 RepID=A0AC35UAG2_9BILA
MKDRIKEMQRIGKVCQLTDEDEDEEGSIGSISQLTTSKSKLISVKNQTRLAKVNEFLETVAQVRSKYRRMGELVVLIRCKQNMIMISPGIDPAIVEEYDDYVDEFRRLTNDCRVVVERYEPKSFNIKHLLDGTVQTRIQENHVRSLNIRLLELLSSFNYDQEVYRRRSAEQIGRFLRMTGRKVNEIEVDIAVKNGTLYGMTGGLVLGDLGPRRNMEAIVNRHTDIRRLENSVLELNEMFEDMHFLVSTQGEVLDNIEQNVDKATHHTTRAQSDVKDAEDLAKKSTNKKYFIIAAVILITLTTFFISKAFFCFFLPIC